MLELIAEALFFRKSLLNDRNNALNQCKCSLNYCKSLLNERNNALN